MLSIASILSIFFTGFANGVIGVIVYLRNRESLLNRYFLGVALSITLWTLSSFVSDETTNFEISKYTSSLAFGFGFLGIVFIYLFTLTLLGKELKKRNSIILFLITALLTVLFSTPLVYNLETIDSFTTGILYIPYIIIMIIGLGLSIRNLLLAYKKGSRETKSQVSLITLGVSVMVIGGLLFNAILPLIINDASTVLTKFGPLFSVFFVAASGYAIIKHKLFDIKTLVFRSFSYLVLTSFIVVLFVTTAFIIKRVLIKDLQVSTPQLVSNILLATILVTSYPKLKKSVDKFTSKIFYKDTYDAQYLLDRLNQTLVTNVDLEELLTKVSLILQEEMKSTFCTFYIRSTSYFDNRIIGAHKSPEIENIDKIETLAPKTKRKLFIADNFFDNESEKTLSKYLKANDIELMARLVNTTDFEVKGIGYFFMGAKKSGSSYTKQDSKILEIIANELVIAIENVLRFEEIEQFNVTLQKKIDDATKELKQTNQKLLALDEAKDEFVSMASHQLRTPLTSIKGYLSMVLEGDAGKINDTQRDMLGQAFFSSQRMVYLISDLLNVSRLKTGKFVIEAKPVYLPDVIESEISQLQDGAAAKNLKLTFDKPKEFSTLNLDEMKIRQVVMNFTDNAIYYTPSGGKISVELKETPKSVEFRVKDSGIGVPKDEQHKLFTKFYRAENARKTRPDGTGLGIFMAKKVVVAQGGSIIFESKEGKGSTFGFSFPKEKLLVEKAPKE